MMQKRRVWILFGLLFGLVKAFGQQDNAFYLVALTENPFAIDNLQSRGDSFYFKGRYDSALHYYKKARMKSLYSGYGKGIVKADIEISSVIRQKGDYEEANMILERALTFCKITDSTIKYKGYIYNLMAVNYGYRGLYEQAVECYEKAAELSSKYPLRQLPVALVLNNLATLYSEMNMTEKALIRLKQVDVILEQKPDAWLRVKNLWTYAYTYDKVFDFDKAVLYLYKLVPLADSVGDETSKFLAYWKLADIALLRKDIPGALVYLHKMNAIPVAEIEPLHRKRKNTVAARIYETGGDFRRAITEYEQALRIAAAARSYSEQADLHSSIARCYAAMGRFAPAYEQVQLARAFSDSMNKEKQARGIAALEARYQGVEKDKAIAEKDKAIAQKELRIYKQHNAIRYRNIIIGAAVLTIVLLLVVFYVVMKSYRQKQKLQDEKIMIKARELELNQIKAMMDVEEQERTRIARDIHDGLMIKFSTVMMNLSALFDGDKGKDSYLEQLDGAISSLRNVAHNLMPDVLLEGGLTEAIFYFCENIKEEVDLAITFDMMSEVPRFDAKFELSVYRIVQELIQNIVKHAHAAEVYVQIGYSEGLLHITVEDDGRGMDVKQRPAGGLGLKSIQNRMVALNGTMEIASEQNGGTSIVLEFVTAVI